MPGIASTIGQLLRPVRPGMGALATASLGEPQIALHSAAFGNGGAMPRRFTADGDGASPPLHWSGLPDGTAALALLVEDVDAPFPRPLVHLVLSAMPATLRGLAEGAVGTRGARGRFFQVGLNSFGRHGWLPPSPVPGHGPHRYVFQLLAFRQAPGRIAGRQTLGRALAAAGVLGHGRLIGTYQRP